MASQQPETDSNWFENPDIRKQFEELYSNNPDIEHKTLQLWKISQKYNQNITDVEAAYNKFTKEKAWQSDISERHSSVIERFGELYTANNEQRTLAFLEISKDLDIPREEVKVLYEKYWFKRISEEIKPLNWKPNWKPFQFTKSLFKFYIEELHHGLIGRISKIAILLGLIITTVQVVDLVKKYTQSNRLKVEENQLARKLAIQNAWQTLQLEQTAVQAGFGRAEALQLLATEGIPLDGVNLDGVNLNLLDLSPSNLSAERLDEPEQTDTPSLDLLSRDIDEECRDRFSGRIEELDANTTSKEDLPDCVHMQRAKFRGTQLQASNLSHANLIQADFSPFQIKPNSKDKPTSEGRTNFTNLTNARLIKADLRNANFSEAVLTKADLTGALLSWTLDSNGSVSEPGPTNVENPSESNIDNSSQNKGPVSQSGLSESSVTTSNVEAGANANSIDLSATDIIEDRQKQDTSEVGDNSEEVSTSADVESAEAPLDVDETDNLNSSENDDVSENDDISENEDQDSTQLVNGYSGTNFDRADLGYTNLTDIEIEGNLDAFLEYLTSEDKAVGPENWLFAIYNDEMRRHYALCGKVIFLVRELEEIGAEADAIGHKPPLSGEGGYYGTFSRQSFKDYVQELRTAAALEKSPLNLECFSFVHLKGPIGKELFYQDFGKGVTFNHSTFNDLDLSNPYKKVCQSVMNENIAPVERDSISAIAYLTFPKFAKSSEAEYVFRNSYLEYDLSDIKFKDSDLMGINLCGAHLKDVSFTEESDLSGAKFQFVAFENVSMTNVEAYPYKNSNYSINFDSSLIRDSQFKGIQFSDGTTFRKTYFDNVTIADALLNSSNFESASIKNGVFVQNEGSVRVYRKGERIDGPEKNIAERRCFKKENRSGVDSDAESATQERQDKGLIQVNFKDSDIYRTNFLGVNLEETSFIGGYLNDLVFRELNMIGTDFSYTSLKNVRLHMAGLDDVSFKGSRIDHMTLYDIKGGENGIDFSQATVDGLRVHGGCSEISMNFAGAELKNSDFHFTVQSLGGTDFSQAKLTDVDFQKASLANTNFNGAMLYEINFKGSALWRANFSGATWSNVTMDESTRLTYANMSNIRVKHEGLNDDEALDRFVREQLIARQYEDTPDTEKSQTQDWKTIIYDDSLRQHPELCGRVLFLIHKGNRPSSEVAGRSPDLTGEDEFLSQSGVRAYLDRMKSSGRVNLQCYSFENFVGSNFFAGYDNFSGFEFSGSDLRGLNFSGTNLSGSDFQNADLRKSDLTGANLQYAKLRCANLTDAVGLDVEQIRAADFQGAIFSNDFRQAFEDAIGEPVESATNCSMP